MKTNSSDHSPQYYFPIILACLFWFVFCAIVFSNAGSNVMLTVVALYVAATWSLIWLIRLIIYWRRRGFGSGGVKPSLRYWLLEPVGIMMPLAVAFFGLFSMIRFALSEPALSAYVEQVREGKVNLDYEFRHLPWQLGLYTVTYTDLLPGGTVRLISSSDGLLDQAGFANSTQSPPPKQGEDSYEHIHQQWWYWRPS